VRSFGQRWRHTEVGTADVLAEVNLDRQLKSARRRTVAGGGAFGGLAGKGDGLDADGGSKGKNAS